VFGDFQTNYIGAEDMFIAKIGISKDVSVIEATNEYHISLFGTPGAFHLSLAESEIIKQSPRFILYDISGRVVKDIPVNSAETFIDRSGIAPGIYTWQLQNSTQRFATGKISTF
jgi:hypothetical protein